MIFAKKIYLILLLWIIIIFGVLVFLLGTNIGTNLIFSKLAYHIPELTFDSVSGSWGNFDITNFSYRLPSGVISINFFRISINLRYILLKQINVEHIFLKNVLIKTKKVLCFNKISDNNQIDGINNIFKNLHSIIFKNMILDNVHIILDNTEFRCHKINSGFILHKNVLKIFSTRMVEGSVSINLPVNILFNKPHITIISRIFLEKNMLDIKSIFKSMIRNLLSILPQYNIPVALIYTNIQGEKFYIYNNNRYNDRYTIVGFQLQGNWNKEIANIKLKIASPHGQFSGIGSIKFNEHCSINIIANYIHNSSMQFDSDYQSESNMKNIKLIITGSLIDTMCIRCDIFNIISVMRILLKITLNDFGIPIELLITGKSIPISISRKNKYVLEKFNLYLTGKLYNNYFVKIKSKIISPNRDVAYISLNAQGDSNRFSISKLKLEILNGYCEMQGIVNWGEMISWNNIYVFNNISILQRFLKHPIILSGKIVAHGTLSSNSWELTISEFCFHGYIKDHQISCNGSIYIGSQGQFSIPMFLISWGSSILTITGSIQKNCIINFDLKLKVINCTDFLSQLNSGIIYGDCKIRGIIQSPELSLKVDIYNLDYTVQKININYISIVSNFFYKNPVKNDFSLIANKIRYRDLLLDQLCIHGKGNLIQHNLSMMICGDKIYGVINCVGKFNSKYRIWNGQIGKTKILTPIGTWKLMKDIDLIYQFLSHKIIIKSHYWKSSDCQFVISNYIQKSIFEKINLICKTYHFTYSSVIPIESIHACDVCVSFSDIDWVTDNNDRSLPRGTIFLSSSAFRIKYFDDQNISFVMKNSIIVNIVLTQIDLFCHCIFNFHNNQNIIKFLITDLYDKPKILGIIQIKNIFLTPILQLLLKSEPPIQGVLNIDISFKGCLYSPKIYGILKLRELNVNRSNIPFFVTNGILDAQFFGDHVIFNGIINTEHDHQLYYDGKITDIYSINCIRMLFNVRGNQINVNISPMICAKISPNLVFIITSEKIDIKGDIVVPSASVVIQEFIKNAVETSSEEVILDNRYRSLNKSKVFPIFISSVLNIYLGDNVNFSGLGLNGKLKGNVEMIYNQNDFSLIGPVNITSGCIEVYGQNLMIKKGQLLFSGALNQTYFDIEAIRNSIAMLNSTDSVTAGIRITGLINQLKLDFFSDSSLLSQQEIMSYLLRGSSTLFDTEDTNIITSLLIGVGMKRCEKLINRIGEVFGVHELKLSTQDFGVPLLIELSGYIAPGLKVQYGINISDLLTTMTIRYRVHPQLYLEVKSGNHNKSLDLLYQFDFN